MIGPGKEISPNIGNGTADGQMLFWNNTTKRYEYTEIAEMVWDDADKELGIGSNLPNEPLHVRSDFDGNKAVRVQNENLGTKAVARFIVDTSGGSAFFAGYGSGFTTVGAKIAGSAAIVGSANLTGGLSIVSRSATAPLRFYVGGNLDANLRMTLSTDGILELLSNTGALITNRMTTVERDALAPTNGMLIYNTTLNKFQGYENGAWGNLI